MSRTVRIGVIEDEPDILALLEIAACMDRDVELVFTATTYRDGLTQLATADVDVVLLDRWLPDADTLEHVETLRDAAGDADLVLLSAQVPLHHGRAAQPAGLDGYLDKTALVQVSRTPLSALIDRVRLARAA